MKISYPHSYAVYIDDVDFNHMTDDQWLEIGQLHVSNLVTVIRNCNVRPKDVSKWVTKWGPLRYSAIFNICKNYPDLSAKDVISRALKNDPAIEQRHIDVIKQRFKTKGPAGTQRVTNVRDKKGDYTGIFPDGELKWHSNEAGNHIFAPGVALLGQENMIGSSTGFLQTASYYEDISESFRSELEDMTIIHRHKPGMMHVKDLGDQDELMRINMTPDAESHIPMVIQSPGGIKGLHYSINTVDGIVGMSQDESNKLFEKLNKELMTEKYMWDHWYESNTDWVFFDNSITNHRRLGDVPGRLAYRIQQAYDHIQIPNYNPYFEKEHADIYTTKLNDLDEFMKENFSEN